MSSKINIGEIVDKNINFLIGSGASADIYPTLSLKIRNESDDAYTVETLSKYLLDNQFEDARTLLFMHYYKTCISEASSLKVSELDADGKRNILEYANFLKTILLILNRRNGVVSKCNIFTTNYDGCIEYSADHLTRKYNDDFIVNDGTRGFKKRYLHAKHFDSSVYKTGVFGQHQVDLKQINLIHLHGSVYWRKQGDGIQVRYGKQPVNKKLDDLISTDTSGISDLLLDSSSTIEDIISLSVDSALKEEFWGEYETLPIVNPTKWKFNETVFEEHYYQMLRYMSYELEKPQSVLICFGFSFADEHILSLVQRSLSNPMLWVYICCRSEQSKSAMEGMFRGHDNVQFIVLEDDEKLNFQKFNEIVFNAELT